MLSLPGLHSFGARGLLRGADRMLSRDLKSVRSATVSFSAFTFGLLQGRFKSQGGLTLVGLPVDLLAGAAFHAFGMFSRNYGQHLHALGDGALASFFTTTGYRVGERWGAGGSLMRGLSGMFGDVGAEPAGGASLAEQQLGRMVKAG